MRGTFEWVSMTRRGGKVQRCHTMSTIKSQSNAEHSFGVAMLAMSMCEGMPDLFDNRMLAAALMHDLHEQQFGDIPAPTKWENGCLSMLEAAEQQFDLDNHIYVELTEKQKDILFWADKMEFMFHCLEEMQLGNRDDTVVRGFERSVGRLMNCKPVSKVAEDIFNTLKEKFNELKIR